MREQVIPQKVANRSGMASKRRSGEVAQRPRRRERERAMRVRALIGYVPIVLKFVLAIAVGGLIFVGYRAAAAASFFQLRKVEIQGNSRASSEGVQALVQREVGKIGVWQADLKELSARLERLPWIRTAVVTRVLPDSIRVRVVEREQRAVVRTAAGRFFWVDDDAVLLGEMLPTDQMPAFFLRGWNEESSDSARRENTERVEEFLKLQREWAVAGLSERVSEVNLIDLRDVRAQLAGDDSQIEIRLGSQNFRKRLQDALNVLDEHRQTPRGQFISYVDLTQGKRAIVGFMSGSHAISNSVEPTINSSPVKTARENSAAKPGRSPQRSTAKAANNEKTAKKGEAKASRNESNNDGRPRRARPNR